MEIPGELLSDIYHIMLIIALFIFISKNNNKDREQWYKYLTMLLLAVAVSKLMSEIPLVGGFSGSISLVGTFLLFALTPFASCLIIKYIHDCMGFDKKKYSFLLFVYLIYSVINFVILLISHMFSLGLLYHFDGTTYTKGSFYDLRVILMAIEYMSLQFYLMHISRKTKHDFSMILWIFPIYTIIVMSLQFVTKNMTHDYTDLLYYSILLYIYIQSKDINTDFLTGAVNRRKFDAELTKRVNNGDETKFSGIMADIDHFKTINDNYGHQSGDDALEAFSDIVIKNFRKTDVVARYGGDEFCILTDICDENEIKLAMERLRKNVEKFNASRKLPFDISLSLGYAIYDCELDGSSAAFLKRLDEKMYQEKEIHHRECNAGK